MEHLKLNNDITVSKIILGGVYFGTNITKENSYAIMDSYVSSGGDTIDTARAYCGWMEGGEYASEATIGEWVKSRDNRSLVKIITKGSHPTFTAPINRHRLSEGDIRSDMEISLNTLQMDYVDLYLLHRDDEDRPVSDIMDTLHKLVLEGKTKAIGVSNWRLERIKEANEYTKKTSKTPLCTSEIQWSYAECFPRTFNDETLICMDDKLYLNYLKEEIPVLAYSSQAGGVFSSGYQRDLANIADKHRKYLSPENVKRYNHLLDFCEEKGYKPSSVVLEYITDNILPACAIIGASSLEQLKDSMQSVNHKLSYEEISRLLNN